MEVLKESLEPFLMDAKIRWNPPHGYSVVDSTPKSLGTVYCHRTGLAFAFLKKTSTTNNHYAIPSSSAPPATISGRLGGGGGNVEVPIPEAVLPPLTPLQTAELASVLAQVGVWSKLDELEVTRLLAVSRKNSTEEGAEADENLSLQEPCPKRPRLNGEANNNNTTNSSQNHTPSFPPPAEIQNDLLRLSLDSSIPCPFTFLKGTVASSSHEPTGRDIVQALPYKQSASLSKISHQKGKNGIISQRYQDLRRRRHHHHHKNGSSCGEPQQSGSIASSLAKSTFSAVSSALMNFVSLIHPEAASVREEGKTIDDELEMGERRGTQLFWDDQRGEIKYPSMYFKQSKLSCSNGEVVQNHHHHRRHHGNKTKHSDHHHHHHPSRSSAVTTGNSRNPHSPYGSITNGHCTQAQAMPYCHTSSSNHQPMDTSSSSDDEEDFMISDSESDSSIELDWQSLPKTREYLPMIQMQLFSGAWPMVHEFSYALRVPLGEIGRLPLLTNPKNSSPSLQAQKKVSEKTAPAVKIPHRNSAQELDEELSGHFWTTALAVTCFRECFPQFESEWELIVSKGEAWLEQNLDQCALGKEEVQSMAKELLFRKT